MWDNKITRYLALGSSIGTSLVVPVVLGILAGRYLDGRYGTEPWFSLAGVLLGLAMGVISIVHIIRLIMRSEKQ
ncbi:MAG TPA: AtpZ/AtpI family protein [Verrucomicrobiae bacterium]|nr:AtpZ/AtpI family protein [Verrucomicrobiae bacterium]